MKWTERQAAAIEIKNKNLLVAAAAGSGKTAVLVERIKRTILEEHIPVDRLLVVTFTNKAAAEMKEKIIDALTHEIEKNPDKSGFLREQLNSIYKANICTFHSFALSVIKRYYYMTGIDPGFKVADEADAVIMKKDALDVLFEKKFDSGDSGFTDFLDRYAKGKDLEGAKELLLRSYEKLMSVPDPEKRLAEGLDILHMDEEAFEKSRAGAALKEDVIKSLEFAKQGFENVYDILCDNGLENLSEKAHTELAHVSGILAHAERMTLDEIGEDIRRFPSVRFSAKKDEKEVYNSVKDIVKKQRDIAKEYIKKLKEDYFLYPLSGYIEEMNETYEQVSYFTGLLLDFKKAYEAEKNERKLIDFSDIEHLALSILGHEDAASEYRDKTEYIFIDEYQDSNLIQEELISKICRKDNVFMVGDVKQSIYKFRLAEPEIFMDKYRDYKSGNVPSSAVVDLNTNFRSKKNVIDSVNELFYASMEGYDDDAALHKGIGELPDGYNGYRTELRVICKDDNAGISDEVADMKDIEAEAYMAVRAIKEFIGKPVFDVKKNSFRPAQKKDIVILLRSAKTTGAVYQEILTQNDIPSYIEDSEGYFDTVEIEVFMNLLKIIDNRRQDIPLISVLYSSVFGFSLEELATIRAERKKGSFYDAFRCFAEEKDRGRDAYKADLAEKCRGVLKKLDEYSEMSFTMKLSDMIWKLMWDTGYYSYAGGLPAGEQRQANLRALADRAAAFSDDRAGGIYQFLRYIDSIKERKVSIGQTKLISENDDIVRIMTIHKSKGLEYPMVILGGLGKQFNFKRDSQIISMHKDIGTSLELVNTDEHWHKKTIMQKLIKRKSMKESAEEELRVLYVGCTRAMDKLVLLGSSRHDLETAIEEYSALNPKSIFTASSYLDVIVPALYGGRYTDIYVNGRNIVDEYVRASSESEKDTADAVENISFEENDIDQSAYQEISRRFRYVYPYEDELNIKSKYSVTEIASEDAAGQEIYRSYHVDETEKDDLDAKEKEAELSVPLFIQGKKELTPAEKGTLYHSIAEHIDFRSLEDYYGQEDKKTSAARYVKDLIDDMVQKELLFKEEADQIEPSPIVGLITSGLGERMMKADREGLLRREVPFTMKKEIGGKEILIQGVIDCIFEEYDENGKKAVLIDYKTSRSYGPDGDKKIHERYKGQIELYEEAIRRIKKEDVKESYIWLFKEGRAIDMKKSTN